MKDKRFFLWKDTLSTLAVKVPDPKNYDPDFEVTMRDCSRQIHWMFPVSKAGLAKAKKIAAFYKELVEDLEKRLQEKKTKR